jgi:hypothetical protein
MIDGAAIEALAAEHDGFIAALVANPQILAELASGADRLDMPDEVRQLLRWLHWAVSEGFTEIHVHFAAETVSARR